MEIKLLYSDIYNDKKKQKIKLFTTRGKTTLKDTRTKNIFYVYIKSKHKKPKRSVTNIFKA